MRPSALEPSGGKVKTIFYFHQAPAKDNHASNHRFDHIVCGTRHDDHFDVQYSCAS